MPCQHGSMGRGSLVGDVGAGMADADDEDGAFGELRLIPVVARVELPDARIEGVREVGDVGLVKGPGGDDHLGRLEPSVTRDHREAAVGSARRDHAVDMGRADHREVESRRIGFEVIAKLVPGRVVIGRRRETHAGEPVGPRGAVQAKRIPVLPPMVTDPWIGIEDGEPEATLPEMVAGRQACLPGPDDDRLDPLDFAVAIHGAALDLRLSEATGMSGRHRQRRRRRCSAHRPYYPIAYPEEWVP